VTLIIGIKCQDGIVLGADGAATFVTPTLQQTTVQQVRKIRCIKGRLAIASAGPWGLGQHYAGALEQLWTNNGLSVSMPHEAMAAIKAAFWPHYEPAHKTAEAMAALNSLRNLALVNSMTSALIAMQIKKSVHIFLVDETCTVCELEGSPYFMALGSGQPVAEPFLSFLSRVFWDQKQPTVSQGIFAIVWTLDYAIRCGTYGLGNPKQLVTFLKQSSGKYETHEIEDSELMEHMQAIDSIEKYLAKYPPRPAEAAEPAPTPPPAAT